MSAALFYISFNHLFATNKYEMSFYLKNILQRIQMLQAWELCEHSSRRSWIRKRMPKRKQVVDSISLFIMNFMWKIVMIYLYNSYWWMHPFPPIHIYSEFSCHSVDLKNSIENTTRELFPKSGKVRSKKACRCFPKASF